MNHPATSTGHKTSTPLARALRVVVVDDDRDTVLTSMALLRMEGHDTKGCHKGSEVLDCVVAFDADVVLLDVALPGMSGWDVARQIRAHYPHSKHPMIIGLSGEYTKGADRLLAQMTGF